MLAAALRPDPALRRTTGTLLEESRLIPSETRNAVVGVGHVGALHQVALHQRGVART